MKTKKNSIPDINLNLNVRGLPPSATLAINEKSTQLRQEGRHIYKLGLGQSPFPVPKPVVEELKVNAFQKDYLPVNGLKQLRSAVAEWHYKRQGLDFRAEDILIGRPNDELTVRIAYVDFDGARALEAVEQYSPSKLLDESFLETYANNTVTAVDLMVSWIHDYFAG